MTITIFDLRSFSIASKKSEKYANQLSKIVVVAVAHMVSTLAILELRLFSMTKVDLTLI